MKYRKRTILYTPIAFVLLNIQVGGKQMPLYLLYIDDKNRNMETKELNYKGVVLNGFLALILHLIVLPLVVYGLLLLISPC